MDFLQGRIQDSMLVGGGGRNNLSIMYSNASTEGAKPCKGVRRYAQPDFFLKKMCNLVHSMAHFSIHCFAILRLFFKCCLKVCRQV